FGKAADLERPPLAQVYPVAVELKNLLLVELLLELGRDQHLGGLALDRLFRRQEETAGQLHGDGRATLLMALPREINPRGLGKAQEVDPAMLEKPAVFDGQNRVHQHLGHFVIAHHLALGTLVALKKRSDHLRLELIGIELGARAALDAFYAPVTNADRGRFRAVVGTGPGLDLNDAPGNPVTS